MATGGAEVQRLGAPTAAGGRAAGQKPSLPDKVAQLYYSLGLFCSTYPTIIITIAVSVVLVCCYPLVNLPLPGSRPLQVPGPNNNASSATPSTGDEPWCYVQQVVVRSAVVPWTPGLMLADAFRGPLYEVFKLLEVVRNYQHANSSKTLSHLCLHVEAVKHSGNLKEETVLPEYSCLVLSPANFWQQDVQQFNQDPHILSTIFNHQNIQKGKTSLAEVLFGMNLKDTGIKRYPLRNRQRILQYAVTLIFKQYDPQYISGLRQKLESLYPLHQPNRSFNSSTGSEIVYIYYPGVLNYMEFVPLSIAFLILFFYVYFSVRKIEMIKCKLGMASAAVVTVLGSLCMSLGLCFFFGLTLSMQGKEIFPYLVILVGLENVLVLTKSVVSTPQHLDVKIRVAQGLSKEGWSITKNILVEITILTIGLATFVPVIQEFCIFAITGLISDFFLQMFFFSTILGIDIHRMEISAEKTHTSFRNSLYQTRTLYERVATGRVVGMSRSKSHPRLSAALGATTNNSGPRIPKRLRLVNMWARTRFFQRAFMVWMVVWISMIVYNSGVMEHLFFDVDDPPAPTSGRNTPSKSSPGPTTPSAHLPQTAPRSPPLHMNYVTQKAPADNPTTANGTDDLWRLRHSVVRLRPPAQHWPALFERYNITLAGSRVAVLPSIRLAHVVTPEQVVVLRHPDEHTDSHAFQWHALAAALDPIDFTEGSSDPLPGLAVELDSSVVDPNTNGADLSLVSQPFYPNSPMEIFLATILCVISVLVLAYTMVVLYRCVCTRNYAEWRASWTNERTDEPVAQQLVMEAVPLVLEGHSQEVECLITDGSHIVSSCLSGHLKLWDAATGEQLASIDRKLFFCGTQKAPDDFSPDFDDSTLSDYESGSPPSRDENSMPMPLPSLQKKISVNFANLKLEPVVSNRNRRGFDFSEQFRQLYVGGEGQEEVGRKRTARWVRTQDRRASGEKSPSVPVPPIWCMDYLDNLIVLGCANGRMEFWEGTTGKLKCIFEDGTDVGITSLKLVGSRVIAAKLNGSLDFLQLQSFTQGRHIDWGFTSAYRRTHVRTGSTGSIVDCTRAQGPNDEDNTNTGEDLRCLRVHSSKAHQQPITALDAEGGRVVSGSQDHTLKVHRLDDGGTNYTLHGHCGPITCLFIDRVSPMTSGSGSQDGLLCVWDLATGACMYSAQAHDGSVTSLTYSASYVISLGTDDKLCVWERFQGHLLNTIPVNHASYTASVLMLTHNLLVTARLGSLVVLDVRTGETARIVPLGHRDSCVFVKQQLLLRDASVVCDYGSQLRIVRFPLITHKFE